jgi:hypothetical protein
MQLLSGTVTAAQLECFVALLVANATH